MLTNSHFVDRTDQKLRFAKIQLEELRNHPSRNTGDDFERSHHESVLFHLYGALDAFLQELNIYWKCGVALEKVSRLSLSNHFAKQGRKSKILSELTACENAPGSELATAKELRHYVTHRGGLPMQHYFNGPSNLVHPITREELKLDSIEVLEGWLNEIATRLEDWRTRAQNGED